MIDEAPVLPINQWLADMENVGIAVDERCRLVVDRHLGGDRIEKVITARRQRLGRPPGSPFEVLLPQRRKGASIAANQVCRPQE